MEKSKKLTDDPLEKYYEYKRLLKFEMQRFLPVNVSYIIEFLSMFDQIKRTCF